MSFLPVLYWFSITNTELNEKHDNLKSSLYYDNFYMYSQIFFIYRCANFETISFLTILDYSVVAL